MSICFIVSAGDLKNVIPQPKNGDYIIAADAGYLHLKRLGIEPDVTVGDFDSMSEPAHVSAIVRHPVMKDDTDTALAVNIGFEKGYKEFLIYGGLGGKRFDHSVANLQTLLGISLRGGRGILVGENENVTVITNETLRFNQNAKGTVSVFSVGGKSTGVTLKGLMYQLEDAELDSSYPLGVSNCFTGEKAEISVKNGSLMVIWSGESADFPK